MGLTTGAEQIVAGSTVVTSDPQRRILEPGWLRIEDGRITAVEAGEPPDGTPLIRGDLVMPGLISLHQHLVDALVRGGPTGPTFLDWLLGTYHAGLAHAGPDDCAAATATVRAACLAAGITTVVDCWSVGPVDSPGRIAECAEASIDAHCSSGGRTVFAPMFCEVVPVGWDAAHGIDPARLCRPIEESLAWIESLAAQHAGDRLSVTPSPELPEMSTPRGLQAAFELARRLDAVMPIHLCASIASRAAFGPDDAERLGLLSRRLLAAHCSAVHDDDVRTLGHAHIGVAHCPSAAMALGASTFTPLAALRAAGATCGIGLDNASLHAGADLFAEARQARRVARAAGASLGAVELLDMLTVGGATAAGLGEDIGSLEVGRRADLIVLDTSGPRWWPRHATWPETVIAYATAADVRTVLVDGELVAEHGTSRAPFDATHLERAARRIRAAQGW